MDDPFNLLLPLKFLIYFTILWHIRREAKQIGEKWLHMILLVWFFWWLVYPLWLFLWPGMHRPSRSGQAPESYLPIVAARKRRDP